MVDRFNGREVYGIGIGSFTAILAGVFILASVLGYINYVLMQSLGNRLRNRLRGEFYSSLLFKEMQFHSSHQVGELSSRATEDIAKLQPLYTGLIAPVFQNLLFVTASVVIMMVINFTAAIVVMVLILFIVPVIMLWGRKIRRYSATAQSKHSEANAFMEESLVGIREVKSFVLEKLRLGDYSAKLDNASSDEIEASKQHAKISHTIQLVLSILVVGIFYAGTSGMFSDKWSMGSMVAFYFYSYSVTLALVAAGRVYLNYQVIRGATSRIIELLEEPDQKVTGNKAETIKGEAAFSNVSFAYDKNMNVLKELKFIVPAGGWLLITGPSGSGKSTIASLLLGFYSPQSGSILIDGYPITDYDIYSLRKQIGYAAQEPVLFHGSIRENITVGSPNISDERYKHLLEVSCLSKLTYELPGGDLTMIGERGITLSGGQRARIAVARALASDPKILILDESNAVLESELEAKLWKNLHAERQNKTTIILGHHTELIPKVYEHLQLKP